MSIVVAHPSPVVAEGLCSVLRLELGVDETVAVTDGAGCVAAARHGRPEMAILDADLAVSDQAQVCSSLADLEVPVVVLAQTSSDATLILIEAGVQGLVDSADGVAGLGAAVEAVRRGHNHIPPHLLGTVLRGLIDQRRAAAEPADTTADLVGRLSPREREVLSLLGSGAGHREIASELFISPHTAKTHINRLLGKLNVRSRSEAAAIAITHRVAMRQVRLGEQE